MCVCFVVMIVVDNSFCVQSQSAVDGNMVSALRLKPPITDPLETEGVADTDSLKPHWRAHIENAVASAGQEVLLIMFEG